MNNDIICDECTWLKNTVVCSLERNKKKCKNFIYAPCLICRFYPCECLNIMCKMKDIKKGE